MQRQGYLKQKEAAKYLGMTVNTFKKYILPHLKFKKVGRCKYFLKKDLDNFMTGKTTEEKLFEIKVDNFYKKLIS